jgi:anti-sigma factor RsiW
MFACRDVHALMTEEHEGALSGLVRARYRFHLAICPHCKAYRRQMDATIDLVKEIPAEPVPETTEERALAAFRTRDTTRKV